MKILWIKNNLLHPLDSGGKIRTYNILRQIKKKHDVDYITYADKDKDAKYLASSKEYCDEIFYAKTLKGPNKYSIGYYARVLLTMMNKYPFTVSSYVSKEISHLISELLAEKEYDVLVADFLTMCLNIPDDVEIPRVHFSHNVEALIWDRHVKNEKNLVKRWIFKRERDRVLQFEKEVVNRYSLTIAVSRNDFDFFTSVYGGSNIDFITTGVDTEYFSPMEGGEEQSSILFLGSMDWMPNIDAVHYFVEDIFPTIKNSIPEVTLNIVGRDPDASILILPRKDIHIKVSGTVPDTRPYINKSSCAIVPIRIGGGTRLKIYEIMAMGKPIVSTSIGAEGLSYIKDENIMIADEPDLFAQYVIKLLNNIEYKSRVGRAARKFVVENCSWESVSGRFVELLNTVKGS